MAQGIAVDQRIVGIPISGERQPVDDDAIALSRRSRRELTG